VSVIALPAAVAASVSAQGFGQARYDVTEISDSTGATATRLMGPPRWRGSLQSKRALSLVEAGAWEAMVLQLRGGTNHLAVYDLLRQAPQGTMRGTMTVKTTAAIGDTSVAISAGGGQASTTLKAGDWLQIGAPGVGTSQLVKVVADAQADGAGDITVTIEPPLRQAYNATAAVTWDKPLAYYKLTNDAATWSALANGPAIEGFALDLLEQWS
jgi:hypothetical protein